VKKIREIILLPAALVELIP